jgi:hypothetical protein
MLRHCPFGGSSVRLSARAIASASLVFAIAVLTACKPAEKAVQPAAAANVSAPPTAATPAPAAVSGAAALIGKTVPPYPDGLEEVQGICVAGGTGLEHVCDFGLAAIGSPVPEAEPSIRYLLASRNADPAAQLPLWQVTDAIDVPQIQTGYGLQLGSCRRDSNDQADVAAIVRHGDAEYSSDVTWARRFDTATGKLIEIPAQTVDCINPGFGI